MAPNGQPGDYSISRSGRGQASLNSQAVQAGFLSREEAERDGAGCFRRDDAHRSAEAAQACSLHCSRASTISHREGIGDVCRVATSRPSVGARAGGSHQRRAASRPSPTARATRHLHPTPTPSASPSPGERGGRGGGAGEGRRQEAAGGGAAAVSPGGPARQEGGDGAAGAAHGGLVQQRRAASWPSPTTRHLQSHTHTQHGCPRAARRAALALASSSSATPAPHLGLNEVFLSHPICFPFLFSLQHPLFSSLFSRGKPSASPFHTSGDGTPPLTAPRGSSTVQRDALAPTGAHRLYPFSPSLPLKRSNGHSRLPK